MIVRRRTKAASKGVRYRANVSESDCMAVAKREGDVSSAFSKFQYTCLLS